MLKITNIITSYIKKYSQNITNGFSRPLFHSLDRDIFVKTGNDPELITKTETEKIFDEIFDEVMAQNIENNPVLKDVVINKPILEFCELDDNFEAEYNPVKNVITVNTKYTEQERYIITSYDEKGDLKMGWIGPKKHLRNIYKKAKKLNFDVETDKLTKDEKEASLKCVLAHELRHCIQNHLKLSTGNGTTTLKELVGSILQLIEKYKKLGGDKSKYDTSLYENLYALTYKPKKILPKDTKLKMSLDKDDTRYWSVYEDFINSNNSKYTKEGKFDEKKYLSLNEENDAFRYEYEYCLSKMDEWEGKDIRANFLVCFMSCIYESFNKQF